MAIEYVPESKKRHSKARQKVLREALRLWKELGDVPVTEDMELDTDWHIFSKGTSVEDIWHWFEDRFAISVAEDLMTGADKELEAILDMEAQQVD